MVAVSRTRVCIKNLPPTTTEKDLKEFLTSSAKESLEITDCKVLKNAKGKSRKVAFVGFRREEQAKHVVENFHRTYLRMSRLSVEPATAKTEETADEKKEKNTTSNETQNKDSVKDQSSAATATMSKQKAELLKIMGAGKTTKFWANDDEGDYTAPVAPVEQPMEAEENSHSNSDEEESDSSDSSDDEEEANDKVVKSSSAANEQKPVSDMDFLRSKQTDVQDLPEDDEKSTASNDKEEAATNKAEADSSDDSDSDSDGSSEDGAEDEKVDEGKPATKEPREKKDAKEPREKKDAKEPSEKNDDKDDESIEGNQRALQTRLFVRNLPFNASEEELESYFSSIGKVMECHIAVDDQKRSKGFAFVAFASSEDALAARTQLDKMDFQGRLLHILPGRAPPATTSDAGRSLTWKQRQELARKEMETKNGGSTMGWSASFVRGDAVIDNLADRLGLRKGELLGVKDKLSSGDAAVRLALGETQIIEENRDYFRSHGVDMDALVSGDANDKSIKRSTTGILVKNLPYDTREEELTKLFHVGEAPVQILLPPSRTIALVEFGHSSDAKRAFKKLAYRRFKHVPIYLEWAPLYREPGQETIPTGNNAQETKESSLVDLQETEMTVDEGTVSATIYVKNLNFRTTESTLHEVFEKAVGGVRAVRIPTKASVVRADDEDAKLMSMGYGFVELAPPELAKSAISKVQGKLVDGHEWELSISSKPNQTHKQAGQSDSSVKHTKLMVRNVPFQATRQELLKLFGSFGTLRKVRLPKKFDGTHRGFAFVDFLTAKEAQTAMTSLSGTHLYGRHLVLEWASEEDDLDKLRDKAKRDAEVIKQPLNKKIKFNYD
jgi:multiple RNA-binding domain-containing protein 1